MVVTISKVTLGGGSIRISLVCCCHVLSIICFKIPVSLIFNMLEQNVNATLRC